MNFGNLFIVGFDSLVLTEELKTKLLKLQPAGVILYDCNIESKEQVKQLILDLKNLLGKNLLVSVDQEGGKVQRLRKICSDLPSLKSLGIAAKTNPSFLKVHSTVLAKELTELGFNLVYAPCADLNTNPENPIIGSRSLGDHAEIVSNQLVKIHNTYRERGLVSCAKHYPGHGDAGVDSHLDLPLVKRNTEENAFHLKPFEALIKNDIEMIMIAHLVVNDGLPASINPELIKELKKTYSGLVISDEITMKALSQFGDYSKVAELLIKAGNNLIIWNTNLDDALRTAEYLNILTVADDELTRNHERSQTTLTLLKSNIIKNQSAPHQGVSSRHPDRSDELSKNAFLEIAKLGMEIKTDKLSSWQETRHCEPAGRGNLLNQTLIIINAHPKLEKEVIEKVFPEARVVILSTKCEGTNAKSNASTDPLDPSGSALRMTILIEFQIKDSDLKLVHEKISSENLLHISTDICHKNADVSLNGASLSHYLALMQVLTESLSH